jgi:GMP synthase-like glutamine amidotransferase
MLQRMACFGHQVEAHCLGNTFSGNRQLSGQMMPSLLVDMPQFVVFGEVQAEDQSYVAKNDK